MFTGISSTAISPITVEVHLCREEYRRSYRTPSTAISQQNRVEVSGAAIRKLLSIVLSSQHRKEQRSISLVHRDSEIRYCDFFDNETIDFLYSAMIQRMVRHLLEYWIPSMSTKISTDRYFNLYLDPMFDDAASGDFNLTAGTPCWNAGDHLIDPDPDGSVADIGALPLDLGFRPPFDFVLLSPVWSDTCWTLDTTLTWEAAIDTNTNDTVSYGNLSGHAC